MYCSNKDINKLIKYFLSLGWTFIKGKKHGKLVHPSGKESVVIASSPSDKRAMHSIQKHIRHASRKACEM